ncbi:hypothetical protein EVAR_80190_1 [Eumeta japonica]|uniref:Uncharacterized protein n=1 Tax=Eumeta variegata TaxID=151549 RepID=A0A4C1UCC0_EUMVA|nr:hypothetical protein EVAR_80190_1 [Eumeta japonica]
MSRALPLMYSGSCSCAACVCGFGGHVNLKPSNRYCCDVKLTLPKARGGKAFTMTQHDRSRQWNRNRIDRRASGRGLTESEESRPVDVRAKLRDNLSHERERPLLNFNNGPAKEAGAARNITWRY